MWRIRLALDHTKTFMPIVKIEPPPLGYKSNFILAVNSALLILPMFYAVTV